ncbi:hypothetical protein [Streptacidiphilus sp. EB103A]|uniref:hypothetical protein n=1 Tax=Streptacidiphilus sp. EB103A TaxID=3156275 RepID=UPI0035111449
MSRESDNPSTPPRPGPDAYPSGTPPYGLSSDPAFSRAGQPAGQPAGPPGADPDEVPPEEPRTETTLTTRIRINIPGSRPIPPVVVRSTVPSAGKDPAADGDTSAEANGANGANAPRHRSGSGSSPVLGVMEDRGATTAPMPDLPPEWRTQDGAGTPAPGDQPEAPSTWFAPRKKSQPGAAEPTPAPPLQAAPPATAAPTTAAPTTSYQLPGFEQPVFEQPGYVAAEEETQAIPQPGYEPSGYQQSPYEQQRPGFQQSPYEQQQSGFEQPPAFGQADYPQQALYEQPYQGSPYQQQSYTQPAPPPGPLTTGPLTPGPLTPGPLTTGPLTTGPQNSGRPVGLNGGLAVGAPDTRQRNRPPQQQDPEATAALPLFREPATVPEAPPGGGQQKQSARQTATPPVGDGFAGGTGGVGAPPRKPTEESAPAAPPSTKKRPSAARRSRKLLVTSVGLLVMAVGVAYGAGLMLNQSDVPKGTTVLGQNIGGDTRDVAVHTLDGTVGVLAAKSLTLVVGSKQVKLNPSVAGLTIDTTATVQGIAHHSYNPASVLPSLFGGEHPVAPVVKIDEDKLRSALQQLASGSGAGAKEGSVHFGSDGSTQITAPQSGQSPNIEAAMALVEQAYRDRAAGLPDKPVTIPVTTTQPKASAAQLRSAADSIGAWAGKHKFTVTVKGVSLLFGKTAFSSSLSLQPDPSGKVVPVFDLGKLQSAIGGTFDGLKTKQGSLVTTQDIATALAQLISKPNGDRTISL